MAGIGFELRRMLDERKGFLAKARAYMAAGLISSGPWLMTILTLTLLHLASPFLGVTGGIKVFRSIVTYCFAFSLILQGIGQMAITRWVADILYAKQYKRVLPAFVVTLLVTGLLHVVIAAGFCILAGFPPAMVLLATILFAIVGMTWISLTWLSIAREYDEVLRAYIYGTLLAVAGMVLLAFRADTVGVLGAYTVGQAFTLLHLIKVITRGMEAGGGREWKVFSSLRIFPRLVLLGVIYNGAIWIDKMVFWFRDGEVAHPWLRNHPLYDTCSFLAYLTVVPALAVNLIRLETSFYEYYRGYYGAILNGHPLSIIEDRRERMFENMKEGTIRLLRVQGFITIAAIIFAPFLIDALELPPVAIRIFRLTALGAMFHVLLLLTMLMQLYFDQRGQALATTIVFFVLNGGLAWWSVDRGVESYGIGYAIASFLSLLLGYTLLHRSLERLDHMTFTNQRIAGDDEKPKVDMDIGPGAGSATPPPQPDELEAPDEEPTEDPELEPVETDPQPHVEATASCETNTSTDGVPMPLQPDEQPAEEPELEPVRVEAIDPDATHTEFSESPETQPEPDGDVEPLQFEIYPESQPEEETAHEMDTTTGEPRPDSEIQIGIYPLPQLNETAGEFDVLAEEISPDDADDSDDASEANEETKTDVNPAPEVSATPHKTPEDSTEDDLTEAD